MSKDQNSGLQKDWWDKLQIIAVIAVPIVIGISGYFINSTLKQREIEVRYLENAVSILREKPNEETVALRNWAVEILRSYSPIPISAEAIEEIKRKPLPGRIYLTTEKGEVLTDEKGNPIVVK